MQPPQTYAEYIRTHARKVQQSELTNESNKKRREIDYAYLLLQHFRSLPQATLQRRWTLEEICRLVPGIYQEKPALRIVAAALRQLGFTEHRDWTSQGRNRRYWLPPTDSFIERK